MMNVKDYMMTLGQRARSAAKEIAAADTGTKNAALNAIAHCIDTKRTLIVEANLQDLAKGKAKGLESALLDRLELTDARIDGMIEGLKQVAALPDPCGEVNDLKFMPSGIQVGKMRVPLGVIGIIYESRPNVTIDAASLCLKSGNAAILRGGSEAAHSNQAIAICIKEGLRQVGLPSAVVQVVETTDRAAVGALITMDDYIDVVVPRGGKSLVERISREATVTVIKHLDGICHVYIDDKADQQKAFDIAVNSKTHRYGVCNAMETLLVHRSIASEILPRLELEFIKKGVELRVCSESSDILSKAKMAVPEDWDTEYLAPVLSIKVVSDMDEAMAHIAKHSSAHTESIVTEDHTRAQRFMREVDSSSVMVNASTRFADGFEYGLGAEIGISTDKIHARGPVGLNGLTSEKWIVYGNGHIRT